MKYRHLGRAGIQVSELSLGSWITFNNQLDVDAAMACMSAAYEAGANFFDNAEAYARGAGKSWVWRSNWAGGGQLPVLPGWLGPPVAPTSIPPTAASSGHQRSLERLQLNYVDRTCHRPYSTPPIEETV
jgi:aryl-alcohol dehydrogenase-like predicted oxidoreductase